MSIGCFATILLPVTLGPWFFPSCRHKLICTRKRINFKIATLTYRAIQLRQPAYLSSLLSDYILGRSLRSSNLGLLTKPTSRTTIGSRRFASAAPDVWNILPQNVRAAHSIDCFKSRLKTHLFTTILP